MRWLRHYDQGIPETLAPYPERSLLDDVAEAVAERPGAPALLFKGRTVTYGELARLSDAFAAALTGLGVARGDRVALLLPNCPQFLICELGAWKTGRSWSRSTRSTPSRSWRVRSAGPGPRRSWS